MTTLNDKRFLNCDAIQELLTDYMARELGDATSLAVREHLRTCEDCRREAAEIRQTLEALKSAKPMSPPPAETLSEKQHKRLVRAVMHPVIDWIYVHHVLVSVLITAIVLLVVLFSVRGAILYKAPPEMDRYPIWRYFKSGDLPALIEKEKEQMQQDEE